MTAKISFLDKMFWITESQANPKHVAALQLLDIPDNAPADYVDQLFAELQSFTKAVSPFDCKVVSFLGYPIKLTSIKQIDMAYHLQLHMLDDISNKVELHKFVAKLHETMLQRDKPLWQYHLIKDKNNHKFVIYIKVHHMCGDGATLIRLFQKGYSEQQNNDEFVPVWASVQTRRERKKVNIFKKIVTNLWDVIISLKDLVWILFRLLLKLLRINQDYMPIPFSGTKTILTGQVGVLGTSPPNVTLIATTHS